MLAAFFSLLFVVLSFCSLLFQSSFFCHEPHLYFCSLSFPYFRKDLSMFAAAYKKRLWQLPCISHSVMFKTKGALNYFILLFHFSNSCTRIWPESEKDNVTSEHHHILFIQNNLNTKCWLNKVNESVLLAPKIITPRSFCLSRRLLCQLEHPMMRKS